MSEVVYQQWKAYQGLLYEYYSDHVLTELPNITHSGWLNSIKYMSVLLLDHRLLSINNFSFIVSVVAPIKECSALIVYSINHQFRFQSPNRIKWMM